MDELSPEEIKEKSKDTMMDLNRLIEEEEKHLPDILSFKNIAELQAEISFKAGAKAHLDKWNELLEQTRGKCAECKNGYVKIPKTEWPKWTTKICSTCHGSGKGEVDISRLVVLAEDQSLPDIRYNPNSDDYESAMASAAKETQQDMLEKGWAKQLGQKDKVNNGNT